MEYTVNIPEWQLKEIEDTLRMVSKTFNSSKKETCLDRCVVKSQEFVKQALAVRVPSSPVMSEQDKEAIMDIIANVYGDFDCNYDDWSPSERCYDELHKKGYLIGTRSIVNSK